MHCRDRLVRCREEDAEKRERKEGEEKTAYMSQRWSVYQSCVERGGIYGM